MMAGLEDFLVVVDVFEEGIERATRCLQAGRDACFHSCSRMMRGMMSKGISRSAGVLAVDGEGDADAMEGDVGFLALACDDVGGRRLQPVRVGAVAVAHRTVGGVHFIVGDLHFGSCVSGVYPPPA
jgi:hypothetical protein